MLVFVFFFFSSRRRHTSCALVTGVRTCALPICLAPAAVSRRHFQGQASRSPAMSKLYPVDPSFAAAARLRHDDYTRLYAESVNDPEGFWEIGRASCRDRVCK